jgi:hypothetical protein
MLPERAGNIAVMQLFRSLTQNTSRKSTASRKLKTIAKSWIADMPVHAPMTASLFGSEFVGTGLKSGRLAGLHLRSGLGSGPGLVQDHAVEQAPLPDPGLLPSARLVSA